jgi:hypothetical protein
LLRQRASDATDRRSVGERESKGEWRPGVCAITASHRTQQDNTALIGPRAVTIERRECVLPMAGEPPPPPPRTHRSLAEPQATHQRLFLRAMSRSSQLTRHHQSRQSHQTPMHSSRPNRPPHPLPADLFRGNSTSNSVSSPAAQSTSLFFRRHCVKKYLESPCVLLSCVLGSLYILQSGGECHKPVGVVTARTYCAWHTVGWQAHGALNNG